LYQNCKVFRRFLPFLAFDADDELQPLILAKTIFPSKNDNLAFVGMYRGPYFGTIELQARWACGVISGRIAPIGQRQRQEALAVENEIRVRRPRPQFPHSDYVDMCDEAAAAIGSTPKVDENDPLWNAISRGPVLPAHYRISGPSASPDVARREIERVMEYLKAADDGIGS
jgi:dimethylaniline monooxygenase (N-oxide forming)